ncbi:hypothetical protein GDO81_004507 [Engystomops pustulosus]|uniref:Uncharacterized protein n=1 Tax=Engystomops pustulosus TaxID=76066 RepID=A0AAV6ZV61_ENGPU|nr:hypothetical protein GDO81_004507 [Engystomops pustulosus]
MKATSGKQAIKQGAGERWGHTTRLLSFHFVLLQKARSCSSFQQKPGKQRG